jgi:drug/metabolite transporter (DMT)-like permease
VIKTFAYTAFALLAFAFNSILCRLALRGGEADAAGFTAVRLASGAAMLIGISYFAAGRVGSPDSLSSPRGVSSPHVSKGSTSTSASTSASNLIRGSWPSAFFLFAYAVCFSFAYLGLTAGTGALILFGSVQITMIGTAIIRGERPRMLEWLGFVAAAGGLVYLVLPGLASPPFLHALLMAGAGAAWGFYTLRGNGSSDPLANTTGNFVRSLPMIAVVVITCFASVSLSNTGMILGILSGAIASGIGYTVWYAALKHLTATRAAILQLPVPLFTAVLGILLLSETATTRLAIASAFVLGGVGLTLKKGR